MIQDFIWIVEEAMVSGGWRVHDNRFYFYDFVAKEEARKLERQFMTSFRARQYQPTPEAELAGIEKK